MEVTMLLCDAAQEAGGKLHILGAGWSVVRVPNVPTPMSLAIKLSVPWDQTNQAIKIRARLIDDDGEAVELEGVGAIQAEGELEVGRPPGIKPGTPLDAPIVFNFGALALDSGGYVWELEINEGTEARAPFRVLGD